MISHQLSLDYTLAPGWMSPFIDGLLDGRAVASKCSACARVSFPPQRTCVCGARESVWIKLSGKAEIVFRTTGADGDFALVQFEGADTKTVARLDGFGAARSGQIAAPEGDLPQIILRRIEGETQS